MKTGKTGNKPRIKKVDKKKNIQEKEYVKLYGFYPSAKSTKKKEFDIENNDIQKEAEIMDEGRVKDEESMEIKEELNYEC
mmetsp:Transcript_1834/g.1625  ORF Transcript_1834/g.1625 Transcript_1834/m.1625 type:complete len:80 (+) Transcript_1834:539-778(+)